MHIAFLTNPASGEVNVQLATAQELISQGHRVTFLSADSCIKKIEQLREAQHASQRGLIDFIGMGSGRTVADFTMYVQDRVEFMRRAPGDAISLQTCIEAALCPAEDLAEMAIKTRDQLNALDPDMICVDVLTPAFINGARLTKRKFVLSIPCSPGLTSLPGLFEPHPVGWSRGGTWGTLMENLYLGAREAVHSRTHKDRVDKHHILKEKLGLSSFGASRDTWLVPPYWEDENCMAGIHFNTPGLLDCVKQSPKMAFVGAGVSVNTTYTMFPERAWMDEALVLGHDVVYINMGSMFIWEKEEFWNCISGFDAVYKKLNGRVRFLFKINFPLDSSRGFATDKLPSHIKLTDWIENQHEIYSHPALKVFVHHGGGNSFNEAVYFGLPQLVLSQWLDTHEYALYSEQFGLGLRSERPPYVDAEDIELKILDLLGPKWPTYKSNCRAWATRSQIGGGPASAAKIILSHVNPKPPQDSMLTPPFSPAELTPVEEKDLESVGYPVGKLIQAKVIAYADSLAVSA